MTDTDTLIGKTVTLEKGIVVTDIGPGYCNGVIDPLIRQCVADHTGDVHLIIARIVRNTPVTLRRANLPAYIY